MDYWASGPRTFCIAGLPNIFLINGPGSLLVLPNIVMSIEQHVDWIGG